MSEYEDICILCHRPESKAGKMFHLPNNICVCDDCMHRTMDVIGRMDPETLKKMSSFGMDPSMMGFGFPFGADPGAGKNSAGNADGCGVNSGNAGDTATNGTSTSGADATSENETGAGMNGTNSGVAGNNGNTDTPDDAPDQEPDEKNPGRPGGIPLGNIFGGFPGGISFINLSDFQGEGPIPGRAKVKKKKKSDKPLIDLKKIPHPHEIKGMLDEYVIGQEHAKKALSVAVYNHYKRIATNTMNSIQIEKSNVLMIGPTGSGKTYLVQTLAKILDVPLAIADATSLTEAGYIGDDIESVVSKLLAAADNDIDRAEMGIVFIDEIDKIAKKKNTTSRDVSGESVQQGLLKLLEGAEVEVPVGANSKNAMVPLATVNTRNILFICGGAFPGLDEIIKQRLSKETGIGFGADLKDKFDKEKNLQLQATVEDVKKFGMIPEFVGRLPVLCPLESLTKEMLISILTEPKNAILRQYEKLLELDEVKLEFDESALEAIAEKAMKRDTGARALRAVIEEFMLDIMYEIPKDDNIGRVTITGDYINGTGGPLIEIRSNAHEPLLETSEPIPLEDKTMTAEGSEDEDAVS